MRKRYRVLIIVVSVLVVLGIAAGIIGNRIISSINEELEGLMDMTIELPDLAGIEDGTYTGEFGNIAIDVIVEVRIKDHRIDDIVIQKHQNGQGDAAEAIIGPIIEGQSLSVDEISGATYSSLVIKKAVEDALRR